MLNCGILGNPKTEKVIFRDALNLTRAGEVKNTEKILVIQSPELAKIYI